MPTYRNILPLFPACILSMSLLNTSFFGNASLSSYFGFTVITVAIALLLCLVFYRSGSLVQLKKSFQNTFPLTILALFVIYVLGHGVIVNGSLNLSHYYWLTAFILITSMIVLMAIAEQNKVSSQIFREYLHVFVVVISFTEGLVVISQYAGIVPSLNELFQCTGTWVNPNVTAMFLAIGLFSQKTVWQRYRKSFNYIQLLTILFAIILLQCRTAYLIAILLVLEIFENTISRNVLNTAKISTVVVLLILLFTIGFKNASTTGRLQIWKNCSQMISVSPPLYGVGFGQFEKEYNMFVVANSLPSADHVYMAYNDFLELFIEGGIIAVVLWISFLGFLLWRFKNESCLLTLITSFIILQVTNFGFQAIPAFALFLIYIGCYLFYDKNVINSPVKQRSKKNKLFPIALIATAILIWLGTNLLVIANAFRQIKIIHGDYISEDRVEKYNSYSETLNFSSIYYEGFGDIFLQAGDFTSAKAQFTKALQTTSRPDVWGKCGWSYAQLREFDSAIYCFKIIEKFQPHKYAPRMGMLRVYELKKDTPLIKRMAEEIIQMPVKIPSLEVDNIKQEARKWTNNNVN